MRKFLLFIALLLICCGVSPDARAKMILIRGLNDESSVVRISAAVGMKGEEAEAVLLDLLVNGGVEEKAAALRAISQNHVPFPEPLIARECSSANPAVREAAYGVVYEMDFPGVRDLLIEGTQDETVAVRALSYSGLKRFNEAKLLEHGMHDSDARVRVAAAEALGALGRPGMPEFIEEELKKSTPELLGTGIIAIAHLGDTAWIPLFKALLREGAGDLRIDAAEALLILGDDSGVEALENGLHSNDPFVRILAAGVLTRHDLPETYPALAAATHDDFINVAVQAVKALSVHVPRQYRELFLELMDAQNPLVRIAGATAYLRSHNGA
jgi:HEAT repeat protein